jgi:putative transposase
MARPLRLEHPGAVWHVTSRGNNRTDIYLGDDDHLMFLDMFAEAVRRFR